MSPKTFIELLIDYNSGQGTTVPTPEPPPVVTPPPPEWRAKLTDDERGILSLANAGQLGVIERTIVKMKRILDGDL
jgi:hypothetical protein